MPRSAIASLLSGGDRRSIGRSNEVVRLVLSRPSRFCELISCLWSEDPVICLRAADAAEKISARKPALLRPFKRELLGLLAEAEQQELRWHLAQIVPRLELTARERERAANAFRLFLEDRSSIVKTCAIQALAELSAQDCCLHREVLELLEGALKTGTPAMKARARNLIGSFRSGSR